MQNGGEGTMTEVSPATFASGDAKLQMVIAGLAESASMKTVC